MLYFLSTKKGRAGEGKTRLNELFPVEQACSQLIFLITCITQASLPGIFFENLESARHDSVEEPKVPGFPLKKGLKKEVRGA